MKLFLQNKKPRLIARLLAVAALIALAWLGMRRPGPADPDEVAAPDTKPAGLPPEAHPVDPLIPDPPLTDPFLGELVFPDPDSAPLLLGRASDWLVDRQGSYGRVSDLFRSQQDPSLELRSDWIFPGLFPERTLPSLRMRVSRDPESGEYRLMGGGIALPGTGWELHYEQDPDREERRGVLQWRKTF